MRRLTSVTTAAIFALAGTVYAAHAGETVDGPRVHWNYSGWGKSRASSTIYENFGKFMEKRTDGNFTVTVHLGTLSEPRAVLDGLSIGAF